MLPTVLTGGRVVDPASGEDRITDLAIDHGRVIGREENVQVPDGANVIDVRGMVVGPGFIDLHSHVDSIAGHRLQALDGVTTALDLEAGRMPLDKSYKEATDVGRPLNYGYSASWAAARAKVLTGIEPDGTVEGIIDVLGNPGWQRSSSSYELKAWLSLLESELEAGALGIGVLLGYAPRTEPKEFLAVARLAAASHVPTYTHVRELIEADPTTPIDGPEEILRAAAETGAAMHHCHVNSTSRRHIDRVLRILDIGRSSGLRLSLEAYPYGAGLTAIGAFFLSPERLKMWELSPSNLVMIETGERIEDEARLQQIRDADPGAPCIVEFLDERRKEDREFLNRALTFPDTIVASDAAPLMWPDGRRESYEWPLPPGGRTHPRTSGTFAKTLRLMVRETNAWSWVEAFRRCSYLPARTLDDVAPDARRKGHLGIGADADVVVLDPSTISDTATYVDPVRPSVGVQHLFVNGTAVVRDGQLQINALPGQPLRGYPT